MKKKQNNNLIFGALGALVGAIGGVLFGDEIKKDVKKIANCKKG